MLYSLNASPFKQTSFSYEKEFKCLLAKITECYKLMIADKVKVDNDENKISDALCVNYLKDTKVRSRFDLTDFLFDREVPEDNTRGRTDIKVQTINSFENSDAYYIIECKRLDNQNLTGITGLNAQYITDGIQRFIERKYSAYYRINGMIGFVVEQLDIDANIVNINNLLQKKFSDANTITFLTFIDFVKEFKYQYYSVHKDIENKKIKLYHLMFDFSKNIKV